jgi:hypothetical protein
VLTSLNLHAIEARRIRAGRRSSHFPGQGPAGDLRLVERAQRVCRPLEGMVIKKVKEGYKVLSEKTGKNLGGPYKTKEEAKKRLQQVEFFKRKKG